MKRNAKLSNDIKIIKYNGHNGIHYMKMVELKLFQVFYECCEVNFDRCSDEILRIKGAIHFICVKDLIEFNYYYLFLSQISDHSQITHHP